MTPYAERFSEVLGLICKDTPPKELVLSWLSHESEDLVDWVGMSKIPDWLQCIGAIEAAIAAADAVREDLQRFEK